MFQHNEIDKNNFMINKKSLEITLLVIESLWAVNDKGVIYSNKGDAWFIVGVRASVTAYVVF